MFVYGYIFDNSDAETYTSLIAYASSLNHGALTYLYGNFIDRTIYNDFSKSDLTSKIPTYQTAELNSRNSGVDFIYKQNLPIDKYLYINVMTDKHDPIMILTTMPVFNYFSFDLFEFYTNPNTEQLLAITGLCVRLAFAGEDDSISVNFVTLNSYKKNF